MIDWLQNPHADYVVAAYSIALIVLLGFALLSWCWAQAQDKVWRKLQQDHLERPR
jgi:hypothetical protein